MPHEIELRFHVPADQLPALQGWLSRTANPGTPIQTLRLQALYFDTPERQLARAGIGLRLRREGERWVQTAKGPAEDGITRLEHNVELPAGEPPELDLARHAGHPLGTRLAAFEGMRLAPTFATDIQRQHLRLALPGAEIELALDQGRLIAGERELAVHELELELLSGEPGALLAYAHGLMGELPLSLDLRSKAERGEGLSQGRLQSPPRKAAAPPRRLPGTPAGALRQLLLRVFEQVAGNASQIAAGSSTPEHLRQLRVGLRRLRSLLALLRGAWPALDALGLDARAAAWARELGALRDADTALPTALLQAWAATGGAAPAPVADARTSVTAAVRQPEAQRLMLELLGVTQALPRLGWPDRPGFKALARPRLQGWAARLRKQLGAGGQDDEALHALRKGARRLRYALLMGGAWAGVPAKSLAPALKALAGWQDLLGELRDLELMDAALAGQASDLRAFAQGWRAARREALQTLLPAQRRRLRKRLASV